MFKKGNIAGYKNPVEKVMFKTLVYGEQTLLAEFRLEKGALLPKHRHPHEQTGYLVSGRMDLTIGETTYHVTPGDSWCILGNVEHHAIAHEDSVAVEAFSPRRDDYIP